MIRKFLSAFALLPFLASLVVLPMPSEAAVSTWQKSATIVPRWDGDFGTSEFRQSVDNLAAANVNFVTLVVPLYQSNIGSTDIHRGWNTPTDESLASAIAHIHGKGLKATMKFHLDTYDGHWRAMINPGDRETWFRNYGDMVRHFVGIGEANNAEQVIIGSELISMASDNMHWQNTASWRSLIASVRAIYSGMLTYSVNWGPSGFVDEKNAIAFWDTLDSIGVSAYFNLETDNSVNSLKAAWDGWNNSHIRPLSQRFGGKPVLFTEVGYRSVNDAQRDPWNSSRGGWYDEWSQTNAYEALFSYWNDQGFMIGVHLWDWSSDPNAGWPGNTDYTPQGKPAENTMKTWFAQGGGNTPPPPSESGTPNFRTTGSGPAAVGQNQSTTFSANVQNSGSNTTGAVVDLEVYNPTGSRILQQFFDNQSFSQNQSRDYSVTVTPTDTGEHALKIGAFNSNWSTNYTWNDRAAVVNVTAGTGGGGTGTSTPPPPPPSSTTLDIWWPTDGARVGGTQPFKAMLKGWQVADYNMFWQVDGDRWNSMFDSFESWPHKEALVDLSGWSWKGEGSYTLNFMAQTHVGTTITEKAINIFTVR